MTKLGWILLACAAIPVVAHGQSYFGIKGGLNVSDVVLNNVIDPDAESDFRPKAGMNAGVFAHIDLDNRFFLAFELLYSGKGVRTVDSKVSLNYLTMPLLVQYELSDKFRAEAGLEVGYLLAATSPYGNVSDVWDNKMDIGIDAGISLHVKKVILGCRFNAGMSSVIRNEPGEGIRHQNRVLSIQLAYVLAKR